MTIQTLPSTMTPGLVIVNEKPLTRAEQKDFEQLDILVDKYISGFVVFSLACMEIRERRLYREKFDTWQDYCQTKTGMAKRTVDQYIAAAKAYRNLSAIAPNIEDSENDFPLPVNEAQLRELAGQKEDMQQKAWAWVVNHCRNTGEKPTAKLVRKGVLFFKEAPLQKALNEASKPKLKETKKKPEMSPAFKEAWDSLWQQVEKERLSNWRTTSRTTVYQRTALLLDALSEAGIQTDHREKPVFEMEDRDKLVDAGLHIVRVQNDALVIEEWIQGEGWIAIATFENQDELDLHFTALLKQSKHIRG